MKIKSIKMLVILIQIFFVSEGFAADIFANAPESIKILEKKFAEYRNQPDEMHAAELKEPLKKAMEDYDAFKNNADILAWFKAVKEEIESFPFTPEAAPIAPPAPVPDLGDTKRSVEQSQTAEGAGSEKSSPAGSSD